MKNFTDKKISIIVPVYNGEKTIGACLSSLVAQIKNTDEIIIVDNNSNDKTKDIVTKFQEKYHNIICIKEVERGRGVARNAGVEIASGEIIAMTDADCIVPPNWLAEITEPIIKQVAPAAMGFQEDVIGNYWSRERQRADYEFIVTKIKGNFIDHIDTKNFAIQSSLLKSLKFDCTLSAYEDWDLFIRAKKEGIKIFFLPNLLILHRHDASLKQLFLTQMERGYNLAAIIKKHQNDSFFQENFKNHESLKSRDIKNFFLFIPWALWQILTHPQRAWYQIVSDFAWKIGIIKSWIKS